MPASRILFRFDHLLDLEEKLVADDARDAALYADVVIDVNAPVPLIAENLVEARSPPWLPVCRGDAPGVQAGEYKGT